MNILPRKFPIHTKKRFLIRFFKLKSFVRNERVSREFPVKSEVPVKTQSISPTGKTEAPTSFAKPVSKVCERVCVAVKFPIPAREINIPAANPETRIFK